MISAVFFAAIAAAWQAMSMSGRWSPVLLPPPESVGEYPWASVADGSLPEAVAVTLRRLLIGYAIGLAIGLPLGLLSSSSEIVEDTVGVLALGLQTLPSVCWAPLALLWFGQNESAMLFVVVMGTTWSVMIATTPARATSPRSMLGRRAPWARAASTAGRG